MYTETLYNEPGRQKPYHLTTTITGHPIMHTAPSDLNLVWVYPKEDPNWKQLITQEFNLHPITAQVLISRGFTTLESIHEFLYAQLPDLLDPALMPNMTAAVQRVCRAYKNGEKVLIYGDNDVDGITGTTLLTELFRLLGIETHFFLTNRNIQRSRLIVEALEFAKNHQCSLLITVDCGVTANKAIEEITRNGIDVIITDHHEATGPLPECSAILNPKVPGSNYPNLDITGVGVAFKLAHGITKELVTSGKISPKDVDLKNYLDLVALGTISDMGALLGENRIFVRYGLRELQHKKRIGLAKLLEVCDLGNTIVSTSDIASKVAPRLNSLGRIDDPRKGVELLLLRDHKMAEQMAIELDLNNIERQKIERTASNDTEKIFCEHPDILNDKAFVLSSDQWHPGVIAILATRISKLYHRPTVIISIEDGIGKGSVRSIPQFSLMEALKDCSDLLLNYGGHDVASGITLPADNISEFKQRFIHFANTKLNEEDVLPKLHIDSAVDFPELTFDFLESLQLLEPHGNENPPPVLYCEATQPWPPKVIGKTHLKVYLEQNKRMLEGIGFGMAKRIQTLKRRDIIVKTAFTPQINTFFPSKTCIQLILRDFQVV